MTAVRVLSVLLGLGLVACAGAAPDDVLGPAASKSSKTSAGSKTPADSAGGAAGPGDVAGAPAGTDSGNAGQDSNAQSGPSSQPAAPGLPGAPIHPDIPPPPGGTLACIIAPEVSSPDQATTFSSCVTGMLEGDHGNSFVRIVAPDAARAMVISHEESAQILYRVAAETDQLGLTLPLTFDATFTDGDQQIRVDPGTAYLFRLTAMNSDGNNDPRSFQINVQFTTRH
jgi:hypothetical protein